VEGVWLIAFTSLPFFMAGVTALAVPLPNVVRLVEVTCLTTLQLLVLGCMLHAGLV
jgi:hypothetical protein